MAAGAKGDVETRFWPFNGWLHDQDHLIGNAHELPVRAETSGGELCDFKGFDALVDDDLPKARMFIADPGCDSDHIRRVIAQRGGASVTPSKINRKEPIVVEPMTYALRNRIERCFNKLKCSSRLAARYDKTAASHPGFTHIAAARRLVRSLST